MRVPAHHVALSCCLLGLVFTVVAAVGLGALDRPTREQGAASPVKDDPLVAAMQNAPRANAIVATPTPLVPYPGGAIGYAISWPQCGQTLPKVAFEFGI